MSLRLTPALPDTGAEGRGLLEPRPRPPPPPRAAAGASPARRGSRAPQHKMAALTERPGRRAPPAPPPASSPPRIRPPTPPSRAQREARDAGSGLLPSPELSVRCAFSFFPEEHLLTTQMGGRAARAGAGGGSRAGGQGGRAAETLSPREASRTGRRPWEEGNGGGSCAADPTPLPAAPPNFLTWYRGGGSRENLPAGSQEL